MTRFPVRLVTLALIIAACSPVGEATTPSTPSTPPSTIPNETTLAGTSRPMETAECEDPPSSVSIVCEAYQLIGAHYVDGIDDATLAAAAAQGLEDLDGTTSNAPLICALPSEAFLEACSLAAVEADDSAEGAEAMVTGLASFALDANSVYLDAQSLALAVEEQEGEIQGIGALVSPEDHTIEGENKQCSVVSETCRILIVSTIEGTPAEAAGLQRDDVIIGVDGESIIGWTVDEVTATVRGPAGTEVSLTIDRDGRVFDVTITRAAIVLPVVESERVDNTGYLRLTIFSENADELFETELVSLLGQGVDHLIIDLRDNPGGLLDTAVAITSFFLPNGDVVLTQGPEETIAYTVTGQSIVPEEVDVVFVVNKGSASASEVISATLQETGKATIVGENTFGKNTVQQRFSLSNGGALKLTVARWLTPGGLDFGAVGVTPDIPLILDPDIEPEALVAMVLAAT